MKKNILKKTRGFNVALFCFKIGDIITKTVLNIILATVFYLVLTPLSFLSKIFKLKAYIKPNSKNSFYVSKTRSFNKNSFEKTW